MSEIQGSGAPIDPNFNQQIQFSASEEESILAQAKNEAEAEARAQLGLGPGDVPSAALVDKLFAIRYKELHTQAYEDKLTSMALDKSFDDKGGILLGKLLLEGPREVKGDPSLTPNMAWILEPAFTTIYTTLMLDLSKMMYEIIQGEAELRGQQMQILGEQATMAKELTIEVSKLEAKGHMVQAASSFAQAAVSAGSLAYAAKSARGQKKKAEKEYQEQKKPVEQKLNGKKGADQKTVKQQQENLYALKNSRNDLKLKKSNIDDSLKKPNLKAEDKAKLEQQSNKLDGQIKKLDKDIDSKQQALTQARTSYEDNSLRGKLEKAEKENKAASTQAKKDEVDKCKAHVQKQEDKLLNLKATRDQKISGATMEAQNKLRMFNDMMSSGIQGIQHVIQSVIELEKGEKEGALNLVRTLMDVPKNTMETSREGTRDALKLLGELVQGRKEVTEKSQSFHLRG